LCTIKPRIDDIALVVTLEQMPGAMSRWTGGCEPVEDDVEAKTQAFLLAFPGNRTDGILGGPGETEVGVCAAKIADQQRCPTLRQKWIEAHMVDTKPCNLTEAPVPICAMDMINRRLPRPRLPMRLSHPG
jgi:hypothetical protein